MVRESPFAPQYGQHALGKQFFQRLEIGCFQRLAGRTTSPLIVARVTGNIGRMNALLAQRVRHTMVWSLVVYSVLFPAWSPHAAALETNHTPARPAVSTVDLRPIFSNWGLDARRQEGRGTCSVITLVGANSVTIYKGSIFTDPGATVTDNVDTTRTVTGSGTVNTGTVGIYTVTYAATDASGNLAVPVTRTLLPR